MCLRCQARSPWPRQDEGVRAILLERKAEREHVASLPMELTRDIRDRTKDRDFPIYTLADILWAVRRSTFRRSEQLPGDFSPVGYLLNYQDLRDAKVDPYDHFLRHGSIEGRSWHSAGSRRAIAR